MVAYKKEKETFSFVTTLLVSDVGSSLRKFNFSERLIPDKTFYRKLDLKLCEALKFKNSVLNKS